LSHEKPPSLDRCRCQAHLSITRPLFPRRRRTRNPDTLYNLHGTTIHSRPIRGSIAGDQFLANSWALPLADNSCDSIDCLDVLEYVRDDEAMIDELARVLRPGGKLRLRVPNAGLLEGLDAYNLYRYLTDITRRGRKPVETDEVGWRRHYGADDLAVLFGARFVIRSIGASRIGMGELVNVVSLTLFRWFRRSEERYRRANAVVRRVQAIEDWIRPGRVGTVLSVEAVRTALIPSPPPHPEGSRFPTPLPRKGEGSGVRAVPVHRHRSTQPEPPAAQPAREPSRRPVSRRGRPDLLCRRRRGAA
jgi:SAM-dependent methyltransferase